MNELVKAARIYLATLDRIREHLGWSAVRERELFEAEGRRPSRTR